MYCPLCNSPTEEKEYHSARADHEGDYQECTGTALYCTAKMCEHHTEPIEDDADDYEPIEVGDEDYAALSR